MQQPAVTPAPAAPDPSVCLSTEQFAKRRRTALWYTVSLLSLSVVILVVGLVSATRTGNVPVAGYYPGIILSFGAFLGLVGINLVENRRPMLVASIIFVSLGVITSFFCAIVDGVIAAKFIDKRPLMEGRCEFYGSGQGQSYDTYHTEVTCYSYNSKCKVRIKSNTCYCCDLHSCGSEYHSQYYEYTGVSSCGDVMHLYRLLWAAVVLNVLSVFLGIVTAAILGAFKDIVLQNSAPPTCPSPVPPPHILYNPTQHVLTYAGFCPSTQALPSYPNYPLPLQHHSVYQPPPAAPAATPLGQDAPTPPSENNQPPSQVPSQPSSQASSSYTLTPSTPAYIGTSYGGCEKPPPYAC
ncbi:transmembrane protein 255B isoform X1 [Brienomyrus brachyistius]|uniref:transmembrane protein 255B isoform X1 n=1 Tax=Brienomyrus brachyistius TaxID=42636 RepID=UPI0020B3F7D5|nr:transmembrane protein 255B isoform X1 [Brienomyrus brachyistius]